MLEQPVRQGDGGVGLAGAGGHLHEAAVEALLAQAGLDAVDRGDLRGPQRPFVQRRQVADLAAPRRVLLLLALEDVRERGRLRDVEDAPRPRFGIVAVGEVGLGAAGLEDERQPPVLRERGEPHLGGQSLGVPARLPLDARQRGSLGLGLDHPDDALVDVEQVVGAAVAGLQRDLADGDALRGEQVHRLLVLHRPAGVGELPVDEHPGACLGGNATRVLPGTHVREAIGDPVDLVRTGDELITASGSIPNSDRASSFGIH